MTKFARPLILALALLALGASLAALYVHYRIIKDPTYTSFCDINETRQLRGRAREPLRDRAGHPCRGGRRDLVGAGAADCRSRHAARQSGRVAAAAGYIFVLATVGLSAVLYLGYASFFVIGKVCPLCLTMYVGVIGIFIVSGGAAMALGVAAVAPRARSEIDRDDARLGGAGADLHRRVRVAARVLPAGRGADRHGGRRRSTRRRPRRLSPISLPSSTSGSTRSRASTCRCRPTARRCSSSSSTTTSARRAARRTWNTKASSRNTENDPKVRFVTMDFPLESECNTGGGMHAAACEAAAAVRMAKAKGKGPEMEEYLFSNQEKMTPTWVKDAVRAGRAGDRLRRAVPEGARAGEGGRGARAGSSTCRPRRRSSSTASRSTAGSGRSSSRP